MNLTEIEASLMQTTPGPYEDFGDAVKSINEYVPLDDQLICCSLKPENAQFFVKAPEYVRQLIDRIKILETCVTNVKSRIKAELDVYSTKASDPYFLLDWTNKQLNFCLE